MVLCSRDNFEKADKTNLISLEVGNYYQLLGASNTEIAANSEVNTISRFGTMSSKRIQRIFGDQKPIKTTVTTIYLTVLIRHGTDWKVVNKSVIFYMMLRIHLILIILSMQFKTS